jgi:hypothetical protein
MTDQSIRYNEEAIEQEIADLEASIDCLSQDLTARGERMSQWTAALKPCLHTPDGIRHRLELARKRRGELLLEYLETGAEELKAELEALGAEISFIQEWGPEFIGRVLAEHDKWVARTELFRAKYQDRVADLKARRNLAPAPILCKRELTVYGRLIRSA